MLNFLIGFGKLIFVSFFGLMLMFASLVLLTRLTIAFT